MQNLSDVAAFKNWRLSMRSILATTVLLLLATTAFAERQVAHQFVSEAPGGSVRRVVIDIPAGSLKIRNGDSAMIRVSGTARRGYDDWAEREQKIVDDTSAEVYVNRDEAIVRRRFGVNAQGWRAERFTSFDLTIEVPRGTTLLFETSYGDVDIHGSFGDVDVALRAGGVTFTTPRAEIRDLTASSRVGAVTTNFGEEIVQRQGLLPGTTNFFNAAGQRKVHLHVTAGNVLVTLTK
jgi:hypothetical protein